MPKSGACVQGFCVVTEALGWQPFCYSLEMKAHNQVSQLAMLLHGVCVATAIQWTLQQKMFAVAEVPVSQDMKNFIYSAWIT